MMGDLWVSAERSQGLLVQPFPTAGELLTVVQAEWDLLAATGEPLPENLPRPWDPATCTSPALRYELWTWLDAVVDWINTQCAWDPADLIPACWPHHPHLVHDLAVLADQHRHAQLAPTSSPLEEWQRLTHPAFLDRLRARVRRHCDDAHQASPSQPAHARYYADPLLAGRAARLSSDLDATAPGIVHGSRAGPIPEDAHVL